MAIVLDPLTDEVLLDRLRGGDDFAFGALVDRHRPWLVRLCTRLLGHDAHAAEDVAQDCLLKLHAAAREGRPLRIRPWLTVVARNRCVDEQRRRRPDLPGELPERAAPGDDLSVDAALTDAWVRLSGRHREVLYLREVLGFSYKEIGSVMGLTMAATETLVFRARAALRREYERSGGSSFGGVLLGVHLARLGADGKTPELGGFQAVANRLTQLLTAIPGCGEQAVAKVMAVAAGVIVAAASMTAGVGPFADAPAAAEAAPPAVSAAAAVGAPAPGPGTGDAQPVLVASPATPLKTMLGDIVPADWSPKPARTAAPSSASAASTETESAASAEPPKRPTPLRDALAEPDRPRLRRTDRVTDPGPIREWLQTEQPRWEERPRPLRTLLTEPIPLPLEVFPIDLLPIEEPAPVVPLPERDPEAPGPIRETVQSVIATLGGDDSTPLRLGDG